MKKQISIFLGLLVLFLLIIFFPSKPVLAAVCEPASDGDVNFSCYFGAVTETQEFFNKEESIGLETSDWDTDASKINDSIDTTGVGFEGSMTTTSERKEIGGKYEAIVIWPYVVTINEIKFSYDWSATGGNVEGYQEVYLCNDYPCNDKWYFIGKNSSVGGIGMYSITNGGPWDNVKQIKFVTSLEVTSGSSGTELEVENFLYELEAWGPKPIMPPTVETKDVDPTTIQPNSVVLSGEIINDGGADSDKRILEWGTESGNYSWSWDCGSGGEGIFSCKAEGLDDDTLYFYRAGAHNESTIWRWGIPKGWGYGEEKSFTTPPLCKDHNVWGWAWSSNIGWISMSCENCDADHDGLTGPKKVGDKGGYAKCPVREFISDYGVDIDPVTGVFSGGAWSSNIGWISFDGAQLDMKTGKVSGRARALAPVGDPNAGGWDGWIKLRGTVQSDGSPYGVYLDSSNYSSDGYSEFRDWAWGGDDTDEEAVIGWVSFNRLNTGAVQDYKVMTDIKVNVPPSVTLKPERIGDYCFKDKPPIRLEWTFTDDPGDFQSAYRVQIDGVDTKKLSSSSEHYFPDLSFNTSYSWKVKVWDNQDAESEWSDWNFFATDPRWPEPDFAESWCPEEPDIGEEIQFCSVFEEGICEQGFCSDMTSSADDKTRCRGAPCVKWEWDFDIAKGAKVDSKEKNPTHSYLVPGDHRARLTVTDALGHDCPTMEFVPANIPLPVWKEIPPF